MKNGKQDLGLFFLSVTGAFSLWSATNTSYTGHMAFGLRDPKSARTAMNLGIGFIGLQCVALLFLYGRKSYAATAGAVVTGVSLYAIYDYALRHSPPPNSNGEPLSAGALPPKKLGTWIEAGKVACHCAKT
jgi:hypothetical protein